MPKKRKPQKKTQQTNKMPKTKRLTPQEQALSVSRFTSILKLLSAPPEPLLDLFKRLEMPCMISEIDGVQCIIIKMSDFDLAEIRNKAHGSILERNYKNYAKTGKADIALSLMKDSPVEIKVSGESNETTIIDVDPEEDDEYLRKMQG